MSVVEVDQLTWPFGADQPQALLGASRVAVDPFPAYAHDMRLVRKTLAQVSKKWPLDPSPVIYVLHYEPPARTNGWASPQTDWDDQSESWIAAPGQIVLGAKRIPPHPAVTRYVVAHEYGHHVEYELLRARGLETHSDEVKDEYAELRGLDPNVVYGGGTWHQSPGEVFANDFRILVAEVEVDYWPHPGIRPPRTAVGLRAWWRDQRAAVADAG